MLSHFYQSLGLGVINSLALLGHYRHSEIRFGDADELHLDWYETSSSAPTVVFFHGGNWRSYEKENFRFVADTLCGFGLNVAIPDFHKYPQHRFETILAGAVTATNYVIEKQAADAPVLLMGHSSGAQLAALLTLDGSLLAAPEKIDSMIGLSGPYDFFPFTEDDHWDLFAPPEQFPRSQPVNFVRPDAPPLYLLHGRDDTRVKRGHSKSLMEKQQAVGGQAKREVYDGMGHVDTIVSFSRIHRRKSRLIHDIQKFIESRFTR